MTPAPIDWLFGLAQFGIKFGLHNIHALVAELGHPELSFRSVHVAGTNGKGSVTAMLDRALQAAGYRTGRYTSPHLLDLTERFTIDGTPVSQADLSAAVGDVRLAVERLRERGTLDVHPTFFEVTTAVGFELFRRHGVDLAVCEVGLGGRLDATNVLSPMVSVISSIAFDHEQYLGHTLREIATEKAGIIKHATPVVVGPVADEAARAIEARAVEQQAPLIWAAADVEWSSVSSDDDGQRVSLRTPTHDYGAVRLGLSGSHQVTNAVVAVRTLEVLKTLGLRVEASAVVEGLATVAWPGRLQHVRLDGGRSVLFDAAHNAAGAEALARHLHAHTGPRPLVFAAMKDKDFESMLRALAPEVSALIVTRASNPRAMDPGELAAVAQRIAPSLAVDVVDDPSAALARAWSLHPHVIVAGSIFLLADVMNRLRRP